MYLYWSGSCDCKNRDYRSQNRKQNHGIGIEYIIFHNKDGYVIEFTKEQAADNLVYLDDAAKKENELYALSLKCDRMIRDLENEVAPDGLPLFKLFWADEDSLNRIDELLTYLTQKYLDGKEKGETSAWTW